MSLGTWKIDIGSTHLCTYEDMLQPVEADGGPLVEADHLFEAENVKMTSLGNSSIVLSFHLVIEHANNAASTAWFQMAASNFNGVADVTFTHMAPSGVESSWTMPGAQVQVKPASIIGVATSALVIFRGPPLIPL
jgi:hypothetical protein